MTGITGTVLTEGIAVHHEVHGEGGVPLVLLHGGLASTRLQFAQLIPGLSEGRRVIGIDLQGHGRTADREAPLETGRLARDVIAVLDHLGVGAADVLGFSLGGAVAIDLAVHHPERLRRLVVSSVAFRPDGNRGSENAQAVGGMRVEMIAGTPLETSYLEQSPHPDHEHLQRLLDKLGAFLADAPSWTDDQIRGIPCPTLITVGDADMVRLEHAVELLRLRGGDVNGDFAGVPASRLAVLPGTSHFNGLADTALVLDVVRPFLDAD